MTNKICPVCGKLHANLASDMCYKHYNQMAKYGEIVCANSRTVFDPNEVRVLTDYAEVDTYDQFGRVLNTFRIDIEDLPLIYKYKWRTTIKGKNIKSAYLSTTINNTPKYFHRLILGEPIAEVDHINNDSTDNRKSNLSESYRSQQMHNTRKRVGKSKYKGVYYNSNRAKGCRWHAELQDNSKRYYSPWYETEEEAILARHTMEQRFNVDCNQDNSILENAMSKLNNKQKSHIIKCLLNKWKH